MLDANGVAQYPWNHGETLTAAALNAAIAQGGLSGGALTGPLYWTSTGSTTARAAQDRTADVVNIKDFGAKQDGVTDDAAAINAAIAAAGSSRAVVIYNNGNNIIVGSPIVPISGTQIIGVGRPVLFLKAGANCAVIESATFQAQIANPSGNGDAFIWLIGIVVDGNSANQTLGTTPDFQNGISICGRAWKLQDITVRNVIGHGIRLGGAAAAGPPTLGGLEMRTVAAITAGRNGVWYQGPSDASFINCAVIDASQEADATYFGFRFDNSFRAFKLHGWHNAVANRVAFQARLATGAEIAMSHFEGGRQQLQTIVGCQFAKIVGCRFYNQTGPANKALVEILDGANSIASSFFDATGATSPCYAIQFGSSTNACWGAYIEGYFNGFSQLSPFNFLNFTGGSRIDANGFAPAGGATAFAGTTTANDEINYRQGGTGTVIDVRQVRSLTTTGSATVTGALTVGVGSSWGTASINGPTASTRQLRFTTAGSQRWATVCTPTAESGSNAGSDYQLQSFDDTGTFLRNPINITRSTGLVTTGFGHVSSSFTCGSSSGPTWTTGTGAPSSTQPVGSMFSRTDGAVGTTLYVSRGGGTWNAVAGV